MTATSSPDSSRMRSRRRPGGRVRIEGEENERVGPPCVRLIDARGRADEAVLRLGDHERWPRAHDPTTLLENHLEAARILVGGELAGPVRRLDPVEMRRRGLRPSTPLSERRRRRLLARARTLALRRLDEERTEVVPFLELRNAAQRDDAELARSRKPGHANAGVPAVPLVQVHDDRGHALEGTRARKRARHRAPGPRSAGRRLPARGPSRPRRHRRRTRPRREARPRRGSTRRASGGPRGRARRARPGSSPPATWPRRDGRTPEGVKRSSEATRQHAASTRSASRRLSSGLERRVRLGREHDEVCVADGVLIRRPFDSELCAAAEARAASREPSTTS